MSVQINKLDYTIEYSIIDSLLNIDIFDTKTGKTYIGKKHYDEYSIYLNIGIDIFENISKSFSEKSFHINNNIDFVDITFIYGQVKVTIKCDYIEEKSINFDILGENLKTSFIKMSKEMNKYKLQLEIQKQLINDLVANKDGDFIFIDKYRINKNKKHLIILSYLTLENLEIFNKLQFNDIYYYSNSYIEYYFTGENLQIDIEKTVNYESNSDKKDNLIEYYKSNKIVKNEAQKTIYNIKKVSLLDPKTHHKNTCSQKSSFTKRTCLKSGVSIFSTSSSCNQHGCCGLYFIGNNNYKINLEDNIKTLVNYRDDKNLDLPYILVPNFYDGKDFRIIDIEDILKMKNNILTLANIEIVNFKSIINFSGSELHIINCDLLDISTDEFLGVLEKLVNLKKLVIIDMKRRFKDITYNDIFFDKLPLLEIFMTDKDVLANSKSVKIIYSDN